MSDPYKGSNAKPDKMATQPPSSKAVKLAEYKAPKGATNIKVEQGDGTAKLPKR